MHDGPREDRATGRPRDARGPRRWLLVALVFILFFGVALAITARRIAGSRVRREPDAMAELVAALDGTRPCEARLAGLSRHAKVSSAAASSSLLTAAARAKDTAERSRTPDNLAALGLAHLALGEPGAAVDALETARRPRPHDAAILTDLSAAYLVRGSEKDEPEDIVRALDAADRAIDAAPDRPEPQFNRGLALKALGLRAAEADAWRDYLRRDTLSGFAREASERLRSIAPPRSSEWTADEKERLVTAARENRIDELDRIAAASPGRLREFLESDCLSRWATEQASRKTDGDALLVLSRLSAAYARASSDTLPLDTAASAVRSAPEMLEHLAAGVTDYADARRLYANFDVAGAKPAFSSSALLLRRAGSPFALWADLHLAIAAYYEGDLDRARQQLDAIEKRIGTTPYHVVAGRVAWMQGLVLAQSGHLAEAVDRYLAAAARFEKARDEAGQTSVHSLLAEAFTFLGEPREAWRHRARALSRMQAAPANKQVALLHEAALAAQEAGYLDAALEFHVAAGPGLAAIAPKARAEALFLRGLTEKSLGRLSEASASIDRAKAALGEIHDRAMAVRTSAQVAALEAEVLRETRPAEAERLISEAIDLYSSFGGETACAEFLVMRGRMRRAGGHTAEAESDFGRAIELLEKHRGLQQSFAISFFDRASEAYDDMVDVVWRTDPTRALDYVERARARALLDAVGASEGRAIAPFAVDAIRSRLPTDISVVYFASGDRHLLAWVVRREGTTFSETPITRRELARRVESLRSAIAGDQAEAQRRAAARLFEVTLAPLTKALRDGDALVVVPDSELAKVPFAALYDARRERFVIQDREVSTSPSGTLLVGLLDPSRSRGSARLPALVVASGKPSRAYASLPALPAAEAEAEAIARLYPGSQLLIGHAATARAFMEEGPTARVLHFAGHAVVNPTHPESSSLLLADDARSSGVLPASRISAIRWPVTQLAVLGACGTADGKSYRGEGVLSLARPFLAAGVAAVVGSLWPVQDAPSRRLLVALHSRLRAGASVAEALRTAQLELLGDRDPSLRAPSAWGAFQLIGSTTTHI